MLLLFHYPLEIFLLTFFFFRFPLVERLELTGETLPVIGFEPGVEFLCGLFGQPVHERLLSRPKITHGLIERLQIICQCKNNLLGFVLLSHNSVADQERIVLQRLHDIRGGRTDHLHESRETLADTHTLGEPHIHGGTHDDEELIGRLGESDRAGRGRSFKMIECVTGRPAHNRVEEDPDAREMALLGLRQTGRNVGD